MMRAADVCRLAENVVSGDRSRSYGDAVASHARIAALWSAYLGVQLSAHDAALMMTLLKVARTKFGPFNLDDYVDAAGYAAIAAEVLGRDG